MRTTITSHGGVPRVNHQLDEGETWERFDMDQPNPFFAHRGDFRGCPVCERTLRLEPELR